MMNIWRAISSYPRRQSNSNESTATRRVNKDFGDHLSIFLSPVLTSLSEWRKIRDPGFGHGENAGRATDFFQRGGFQKRGSS
jgi:hypothetical protein